MKGRIPPKLPGWIIRRLSVYEDMFAVTSDLEEEYIYLYGEKGKFRSGMWYWKQTFRILSSYFFNSITWKIFMLNNYLKIALRNIKNNKSYSFLNIFCLTLGIACCTIIMIWMENELSFDSYHKNSDQLYRVTNNWGWVTPQPLASELKNNYPEIVNSSRFITRGGRLIKYEDKKFYEDNFVLSDPELFQMLDFYFTKDKPDEIFRNINDIILTESMSKKYFGNADPVGKVLNIDNKYDFIVTGVLKDFSQNTMIKGDFFISFEFIKYYDAHVKPDDWGYNSYNTLIQVQKNALVTEIGKKLSALSKLHFPDSNNDYIMQNIRDLRLYDIKGKRTGMNNIYIFSALAFLVLLMACINFMYLSTAGSFKRAKEICMRKTVGAKKTELLVQFLGESFLLSLFAFVSALFIVKLSLPLFSELAGINMTFDLVNIRLISGLFGIILFTALLSGSYPALYLSSFQPVSILKGTANIFSKHKLSRRLLVLSQFSLSTLLVICLAVIYLQLDFMKNRDLGYNSRNVIFFRMKGGLNKRYKSFKNELKQNPVFFSITAASSRTGADTHFGTRGWSINGKEPEKDNVITGLKVDSDYFNTMGMKIVLGNDFKNLPQNTAVNSVVLNETAVKTVGINSPVGKRFTFWNRDYTIAGIVKDYNYDSLHESIIPVVIVFAPEECRSVVVRITGEKDISEALAFLKSKWEEYVPGFPFEYYFLDESVENMYGTEKKTITLLSYFTFLIISISSLGLFGLSLFTVSQRTKEIGIRKVLGATVFKISGLLTTEFVMLMLMSYFIAWPSAYFIMNRWLLNFAYKTDIGTTIYVLSSCATLFIALAAVSYHTVKAARANPVNSLKYE